MFSLNCTRAKLKVHDMGSALKVLLAITKTSVWPNRLGELKSEAQDWCEFPAEEGHRKQ